MTDAPSTCVTVESVEHMERSDARHDLTIVFTSTNGQRYTLLLPPGICYQLLVGLVGMQPPQGGGQVPHIAAIKPERVSTFGTSDGTVGLSFDIGGGWALPIAIDAENIDGVRGQLVQLERMASRGAGSNTPMKTVPDNEAEQPHIHKWEVYELGIIDLRTVSWYGNPNDVYGCECGARWRPPSADEVARARGGA